MMLPRTSIGGRRRSANSIRTTISAEDKHVLVDDADLRAVVVQPKLRDYLRQIYERRHFTYMNARSRAFTSDRELLLGRAWLIVNPLLSAAMYGVMFGLILQTSRGIDNFIGYLIIGITFFSFMQGPLQGGNGLVRSSRGLLTAFDFPAATLVVSQGLKRVLDAFIPSIIAVVCALAFQPSEPVSWTIVLVVPLFFMVHIFGTGLMFFSARFTAQIPDLKNIISLAGRAWFFVSGVFFSIERFVDHPQLLWVMQNNPAYRFLQAVRGVVMWGEVPDLHEWLILTLWAFGTLILGFLFFWRGEEHYTNA